MEGMVTPIIAPMRLLQAVQLNAGVTAVELKLGAPKLERETITARLYKRFLKAPELPEAVLLGG